MPWWIVSFNMPVAGTCVGRYSSYDDRSDAFKIVQDAAGQYIRVPVRTAADVEILIITEAEWQRIRGNVSTASYKAAYTTGRTYAGTIAAKLDAGWYRLVVYNGFSLAAKSVDLTFGGKLYETP